MACSIKRLFCQEISIAVILVRYQTLQAPITWTPHELTQNSHAWFSTACLCICVFVCQSLALIHWFKHLHSLRTRIISASLACFALLSDYNASDSTRLHRFMFQSRVGRVLSSEGKIRSCAHLRRDHTLSMYAMHQWDLSHVHGPQWGSVETEEGCGPSLPMRRCT